MEKDPNAKKTIKSDGKGKKKSYTKKQLAAIMTQGVKLAIDKSSEETKTQDDTKAYIMSLIEETMNKMGSAPGPQSQTSAASTLNSILKGKELPILARRPLNPLRGEMRQCHSRIPT